MTAIFLSFNDSDTQILEVGIFPFNFILYTLFFLFTICEWWKTMLGATKKPITNHLELDNYDKLNCNRFTFFLYFQHLSNTLYRSGKLAICKILESSANVLGGKRKFRKALNSVCSTVHFQVFSSETSPSCANAWKK